MTGAGYEIRTINGLGRAAVATKDFAIGELIISETPVLTVPVHRAPIESPSFDKLSKALTAVARVKDEDSNGQPVAAAAEAEAQLQASAIVTFLDLNETDRINVLTNFAAPPQDTPQPAVELIKAFAKAASSLESMPSEEALQKLLLVLATNAHEFVEDGAVYVGLYEKGSKLAHSCSPKTVYLGDGRTLKHYALQPIKTGDIITTNYTVRDDILFSLRVHPLYRTGSSAHHSVRHVQSFNNTDYTVFCGLSAHGLANVD
ncbi:hypothetical protein HDU88_001216 [Geranomyces variabilis]|nr:hypothetical protein HDU88_001216 [Geranomyces variabilis]